MENCYRFEFKYKTIKWAAEGEHDQRIYEVKRPVAMVLMKGSNGTELVEPFLIDSGADSPFIKHDLAELLGLELSGKTTKVKTAGADIEVRTASVDMGLVQGSGYCPIGDNVHAYVFSKEKRDVPNIIGRTPLFDKFKITFRQYDGTVLFAYMAKIMARRMAKDS
jgi:hypothetical protein